MKRFDLWQLVGALLLCAGLGWWIAPAVALVCAGVLALAYGIVSEVSSGPGSTRKPGP